MDILKPNDVILFGDECSVKYSPTLTRCWALKGQQPEIETFGGRKRQHLIGVVEPLEGRIFVDLVDTLKALQFQTFLEQLIEIYDARGKILLIVDNARAHHAKILELFLEKIKDKLELIFLPPYSPNLNPIERFWKFMRKMVTHNTFFSAFEKFLEALKRFCNKFKCPSAEIVSLCRIS